MKKDPPKIRRQIFVFTREEKKAAACVLGAFLLGLATKHYRDTHPTQAPQLSARQQFVAQRAAKSANARARSARSRSAAKPKVAPTPAESPDESDDE
ncbi:MAG: hypothetical protein M3Y86_04745 [Verrucomicrobiota bacterium]|nr:hypothetical protein [Verrucomicrobiota bacterium]